MLRSVESRNLDWARGREAKISPGLSALVGADSMVRSCDNGTKNLGVPGAGLLLKAAAKVATTGDQSQGHKDSEDR